MGGSERQIRGASTEGRMARREKKKRAQTLATDAARGRGVDAGTHVTDALGPDVLVELLVDADIVRAHALLGQLLEGRNGLRGPLLELDLVHNLVQVHSAVLGPRLQVLSTSHFWRVWDYESQVSAKLDYRISGLLLLRRDGFSFIHDTMFDGFLCDTFRFVVFVFVRDWKSWNVRIL